MARSLVNKRRQLGGSPRRPRERPWVFLDYTQEELDRAYEQFAWAPDGDAAIRRYATDSAAVRESYEYRTYSYGRTASEKLDVFLNSAGGRGRGAAIHVFVHGGAWQQLSKQDSSFLAPPFVEAGAHFVALDFAPIPHVRLPQMVNQLRRAISWIYRNAHRFGGDRDRIFVSGHSSGGHLAGVLVTADWSRYRVPADVLAGALLCSGMYDLRPVLLSSRRAVVELSGREEDELSPQRHSDRVRCPTIIAYGEKESPEFIRQSRAFAAQLATLSPPTRMIVVPQVNHFEVPLALADSRSALSQAALAQMEH